MIVFLSQIVGGHDIKVEVYIDPEADGLREDWKDREIEMAKADPGEPVLVDGEGPDSLIAVSVDIRFVLVSWQDPEPGHAIYGPFTSESSADENVAQILRDYHGIESMDQVPMDVIVTIEEPIAP